MYTAENTAGANLDTKGDSIMLFSISCRALNLRKGSTHSLLILRNSFSGFVPIIMCHAQNCSIFMTGKAARLKQPVRKSMLLGCGDAPLDDMGTEQV